MGRFLFPYEKSREFLKYCTKNGEIFTFLRKIWGVFPLSYEKYGEKNFSNFQNNLLRKKWGDFTKNYRG